MANDVIRIVYESNLSSLQADLNQAAQANMNLGRAANNASHTMEQGYGDANDQLRQLNQNVNQAEKQTNSFGDTLKKLRNIAAVAFAADLVIDFGKKAIESAAKYEKMGTVLANALGSKSEAQKAMRQLQDFSAKTPFQVDELTASYIKLVNQGFKPTEKQMTSLGDLASAQGKSFDQLTEAIIDAQTGEFERLKEFGIRASVNNDKVTFSFKGQQQTVDYTNESIRKYIISLGDLNGVAGGMAAISDTASGKISNLQDNMDLLAANVGTVLLPVFNGMISSLNDYIGGIKDAIIGMTPMADGLRVQQVEFNALGKAIMDTNTPTESRAYLIEQINNKFKDYLPNLLTEQTSISEIKEAMELVNKEFEKKILLTAKEETTAALLKKQSDAYKDIAYATVEINKAKAGGGDAIIEHTMNLIIEKANQGIKDSQAELELYNKAFEETANKMGLTYDERNQSITKSTEETETAIIDITKMSTAELQEIADDETNKKNAAAKKELERRKKYNDELIKADDQYQELHIKNMEDGIAKDIALEQDRYRKLLREIKDNQKLVEEAEIEHWDNLEKIREKHQIKVETIQMKGIGNTSAQNEQARQDELTGIRNSIGQATEMYQEDYQQQVQLQQEAFAQKQALREAEITNAQGTIQALANVAKQGSDLQKALLILDKFIAIAHIVSNTQVEIAGYFAKYALIPGGEAIAAGLATQAKIRSGLSIATIIAQAIPQLAFKEGVIDLKGPGTGTSDSIPARLSRGESVMTARETDKYRPALEAMRRGEFEKQYYSIADHNRVIVAQILSRQRSTEAQYNRIKQAERQDFAENVARAMIKIQNNFDDKRIVNAIEKNRPANGRDMKQMGREIGRAIAESDYVKKRKF